MTESEPCDRSHLRILDNRGGEQLLDVHNRKGSDFRCCAASGLRHEDFCNTIWLVIITVLTVGYGDMYPITDMGKVIAIFAGFGGLLLSAALITMVHKYLTLTEDEKAVMDFI